MLLLGSVVAVLPIVAQDSASPNALTPDPQEELRAERTPSATSNSEVLSKSVLLYRQLRSARLDPKRIFRLRNASLEREDVHFTFENGVIGFLQEIDGRVTGAFFEGEGEVLIIPPDRVEKRSLGVFTKQGVLEEHFSSVFLRFNDETFSELAPFFRASEEANEFVTQWDASVGRLAEPDALRLLLTVLNAPPSLDGGPMRAAGDRMLHARVGGNTLGTFDLVFDTNAAEQISVGQTVFTADGSNYFNSWMSFPMRSHRIVSQARTRGRGAIPAVAADVLSEESGSAIRVNVYKIRSHVSPPTNLESEAVLEVDVLRGGDRVLMFELSRYLKVSRLEVGGKAIDFLQNDALDGSALSRRGNDLVAAIFPAPLEKGQKLSLRFQYSGSVLSDAGGGLLYVGARGIWFPNRGLEMSNFDLEFHHPTDWSLVATGKKVSSQEMSGEEVSRWVSERPTALAGFNLGQYKKSVAKAGEIEVEVFATRAMERTFQRREIVSIPVAPVGPIRRRVYTPPSVIEVDPEPFNGAQKVAEHVSRGIEEMSKRVGPFPFSSLALSQMPGRSSQGWPGLVFLSSYSFLDSNELRDAKLTDFDTLLYTSLMPLHEVAHQWWGDAVGWKSYRDQWLTEALATYTALAAIEIDQPKQVDSILEHYRTDLLEKNKEGNLNSEAGPVTLGIRLLSSHNPVGYDLIAYGRGAWLLHMLRTMLIDGEAKDRARPGRTKNKNSSPDEPFFRVLKKVKSDYEGKTLSTADLQRAFEAELPESLRFNGRKSLDWFFDEWVNGTAIPRIELNAVKISGGNANGKIEQKEAPEELVTSVPIYAITSRSKTPVFVARVFAEGPETTLKLNVPIGTQKLVVDPYRTLLTRR